MGLSGGLGDTCAIIELMLIEASKIIGLSVGALQEQIRVGKVKDLLVNSDTGALLGILVEKIPLPFFPLKGVSFQDVVEFDRQGVVINSGDSVLPLEELVRLKEAVKGPKLLGLRARTERGVGLGRVYDYLLDTTLGQVMKFYLKDIFQRQRVISREQVVKITKKEMIVMDENGATRVAGETEVETA